MSWGRYEWAPYVSVARKLSMASAYAAKVAKKQNRKPAPVTVTGRTIARTFWGKAWCDNLTAYQDFSNRLPRGATYVRNGSVVDLVIQPKKIEAIVAGSEPYSVKIEIGELAAAKWKAIRSECSQSIESLLDLLAGKFSDGIMQRLTDRKSGLFPSPAEIRMSCSCPDYSSCCKHLAAVMYGVGARLDSQPELLFLLRGVDHQELISQAMAAGNLDRELSAASDGQLGGQDLSQLFGIELDAFAPDSAPPKEASKRRSRNSRIAARTVAPPAAPDDRSDRSAQRSRRGRAAKVSRTPKKVPVYDAVETVDQSSDGSRSTGVRRSRTAAGSASQASSQLARPGRSRKSDSQQVAPQAPERGKRKAAAQATAASSSSRRTSGPGKSALTSAKVTASKKVSATEKTATVQSDSGTGRARRAGKSRKTAISRK